MKYKFSVVGLDCPSCAAKLAAQMEKIEGVDAAKINFLSERLTVESGLDEDMLLSLLSESARRFSPDVKVEK